MLTLNRFGFPVIDRMRDVNDFFNGFFDGGHRLRGWPPVNLWEEGDRLMVEAEVPGLSMQDLEIFVVGDELTIKGTRKPAGNTEATCHRCERGVGEFARVMTLPMPVDAEKVEAFLKNGILTVVLPKAEVAKPRKITVKPQ